MLDKATDLISMYFWWLLTDDAHSNTAIVLYSFFNNLSPSGIGSMSLNSWSRNLIVPHWVDLHFAGFTESPRRAVNFLTFSMTSLYSILGSCAITTSSQYATISYPNFFSSSSAGSNARQNSSELSGSPYPTPHGVFLAISGVIWHHLLSINCLMYSIRYWFTPRLFSVCTTASWFMLLKAFEMSTLVNVFPFILIVSTECSANILEFFMNAYCSGMSFTCSKSLFFKILWNINVNISEIAIGLIPPSYFGRKTALNSYSALESFTLFGSSRRSLNTFANIWGNHSKVLVMYLMWDAQNPCGPLALCSLRSKATAATSSAVIYFTFSLKGTVGRTGRSTGSGSGCFLLNSSSFSSSVYCLIVVPFILFSRNWNAFPIPYNLKW